MLRRLRAVISETPVGLDAEMIRKYVKYQEQKERNSEKSKY